MADICVIVPTYNYGAFIGEAIASIQAQTLQPQQILVIDDGSSDDTSDVVSRLQAPNLRYVRQANAGVSAARNHGLRLVSTDYVTFLDADDRWRPTMLEQQLRLLQAAPGAAFSFSNFVRFQHETGDLLQDQFSLYPELSQLRTQSLLQDEGYLIQSDAFDALIGFGEIPAYTQVMMFNTQAIAGLYFNESLRICEDLEFVLRAALRGMVVYTPKVLAEVRRHDSNITTQYSMMAVDKLNALRLLRTTIPARHQASYQDRMVKAHVDAAIACCRNSEFQRGVMLYAQCLKITGSPMRKLKGGVRMLQSTLAAKLR